VASLRSEDCKEDPSLLPVLPLGMQKVDRQAGRMLQDWLYGVSLRDLCGCW
jgi:hypothetical protein